MKKGFPWPFALVLVLVTASLVGVVLWLQKPKPVVKPAPDVAALGISYTVSMREIVKEYRATQTPTAARAAESRMLNLMVPEEYRGLHLDLVLALHRFGASSAKTQPDAKAKVESVIATAAWLN